MIRRLRRQVLAGCDAIGAMRAVADSGWRRRRILILGYHGIAIDREHEWRPRLYMPAEQLRSRLQVIREQGYTVLPLIEAMWRLRKGSLPRRAVVLTFDDGGYDFYAKAMPLLEEFGFPATVYLTTYYTEKQRPIFPLMCGYLLWLARERGVVPSPSRGDDVGLDLTTSESVDRTFWDLLRFARQERLSDEAKQALLGRLAERLDIDYESVLASRVLQLMNPREVGEVARAGIDVQMHTHRHRSPVAEEEFLSEVRENRERIAGMTGRLPRHFCYPSGAARPEFVSWLRAEGIHSATTCRAALATKGVDRLLLPRLLDHSSLSSVEFEAWLGGLAHFTTRHRAELTVAPDSPAAQIAFAEPMPRPGASLAPARH